MKPTDNLESLSTGELFKIQFNKELDKIIKQVLVNVCHVEPTEENIKLIGYSGGKEQLLVLFDGALIGKITFDLGWMNKDFENKRFSLGVTFTEIRIKQD